MTVRSGLILVLEHHHVDLVGNFARTIDNQAYQFELLRIEDLGQLLPGCR